VLVVDGVLNVGERVVCEVDGVRRSAIRAHHSATHLLHWALESVLGAHIKQEGSVVRDDMLRFDFRHFAALSVDEVSSIEALVNQRVVENSPVDTRELDMDDAMKLGAKAFFDEKYGARVRVVTMGAGVSRELCGGTHAGRTGDIGLMKILRQEAVSAGVRRVYAVCHLSALRWMQDRERQLGGLAETLRCGVEDVAGRVDKLLERVSEQDRNLKELEKKLLAAQSGGTSDAVSTFAVKGETLGVVLLPDGDNVKVRDMADLLRDRIHPGVVLVGGVQDGKLLFVVARTSDSHLPLHCGKIVQEIARVTGARGGGKPDFGQAGGGEPGQWDAAVETFRAQASLE